MLGDHEERDEEGGALGGLTHLGRNIEDMDDFTDVRACVRAHALLCVWGGVILLRWWAVAVLFLSATRLPAAPAAAPSGVGHLDGPNVPPDPLQKRDEGRVRWMLAPPTPARMPCTRLDTHTPHLAPKRHTHTLSHTHTHTQAPPDLDDLDDDMVQDLVATYNFGGGGDEAGGGEGGGNKTRKQARGVRLRGVWFVCSKHL